MGGDETVTASNFVRHLVEADIGANKNGGKVATRFPPEPNGYLHIGHAKSICLNFGIAQDYNGKCNLRFDDTNPHKENVEYVEAIKNDVHWLGYDWGSRMYYASDYFEQLYEFAIELIRKRKAYICDLTAEQIREYRGTLTEPGKESPYRDRGVEENLDLLERMRNGEFADGSRVLRARIDMASPNINMRDPALYRIRHGVIHHQTGEAWCIYPMYDFTHPISDALEGITHSICTLEFEDHRPLYDWVLDNVSVNCHPQQIEFSRLNLEYTVMSKRKLTELVEGGYVEGWDDPHTVEMGVLENCIREDLNVNAPRRMAVLHPLKVVITDYPADQVEYLETANHPQDESLGTRRVPFTGEVYIDRDDFREEAPRKFKRLVAGGEVRLRNAYVIRCEEVIKDAHGEIIELHCSHDPATLGANPEGRKVKGVIHWVSVQHGLEAEVRLYDRLFTHPGPDAAKEGKDYKEYLNPDSLRTATHCIVEPDLAGASPGDRFQFEREGYFCADEKLTRNSTLVFNRTVTLRDSWAKIEQQLKG
jgi:glutaminyl-tRNA synthetase